MELLLVARNVVRSTRGSTTDKQNTPILDLVARLPDVFSKSTRFLPCMCTYSNKTEIRIPLTRMKSNGNY